MKKRIAALLVLILMGLCACEKNKPEDTQKTEPTQSTTIAEETEDATPEEPLPTGLPEYFSTIQYAITPDWFYLMDATTNQDGDTWLRCDLRRVNLLDGTEEKPMPLPDYNGEELNSVVICGVTDEYLYFAERHYDDEQKESAVIFRVPHETMQAELVTVFSSFDFAEIKLSPSGKQLLYPVLKRENPNDDESRITKLCVEGYDLNSGERHVVYDALGIFHWLGVPEQTMDGRLAFHANKDNEAYCVVFDENDHVQTQRWENSGIELLHHFLGRDGFSIPLSRRWRLVCDAEIWEGRFLALIDRYTDYVMR